MGSRGEARFCPAFHVTSALPTGQLSAPETSAYSGADTVDILIKGVGAHGASPHTGVDPIVLGSQIVMGLQTVVAEPAPRRPGVITVGSFPRHQAQHYFRCREAADHCS